MGICSNTGSATSAFASKRLNDLLLLAIDARKWGSFGWPAVACKCQLGMYVSGILLCISSSPSFSLFKSWSVRSCMAVESTLCESAGQNLEVLAKLACGRARRVRYN